MAEPLKPISQPELDIALSGPAILTNRFFVSVGPNGVRIAFTEQGSPDHTPVFRAGVGMSIPDAISLYRLLRDLLKEHEKAYDEAIVNVTSPPKT